MFYEGASGYRSFSHYIRTFATVLRPILPLGEQLLINRNCSFWLNETLDIIGWWRKFIKVIFLLPSIFATFFLEETNGKIHCKERLFLANFQPQRHLEWSSLHYTPEQKLISQKTKRWWFKNPLAMGYIFFICSSNTQQEEEEEEEENCRESQYLQIYIANNSTPLTFILILDKIVVEVCDEFTL